jgi:hypothetical protein
MDDSEDDELSGAPPVNDIYRQRQQKRVKWLVDHRIQDGSLDD